MSRRTRTRGRRLEPPRQPLLATEVTEIAEGTENDKHDSIEPQRTQRVAE